MLIYKSASSIILLDFHLQLVALLKLHSGIIWVGITIL